MHYKCKQCKFKETYFKQGAQNPFSISLCMAEPLDEYKAMYWLDVSDFDAGDCILFRTVETRENSPELVCPNCNGFPLTLSGKRKGLDLKITDGLSQCPFCFYEEPF